MKEKLLFVVNVDWFFISHRLPIGVEAINKGYEVHIACAITQYHDFLTGLGFVVHPITLSRSGTNFISEFRGIFEIYRLIKSIAPDVLHTITIKPVVYGSLMGKLLNIQTRVASISGLGFVFISNAYKIRFLKIFITFFYKIALNGKSKVIFQNSNDQALFIKLGIINQSQAVLIRGSGVQLSQFKFTPEPDGVLVVMFLARLLKDKGLVEFCSAAEHLLNLGVQARFVLVGDVDFDNPNSITKNELSYFVDRKVVEHWGYRKEVEHIIPLSNIMVLPSYREGLPKSLIEAAACGRAVITSDVPGCRDAIIENKTGLLVPAKNVLKLASAINNLLTNSLLRNSMGEAGRQLAIENYDINDVIDTHLKIYEGLI
jgi:glycosyltransferase involved in cell wall biosynthesis